MINKNILSILFYLLCSIGCTIQVHDLIVRYLKYETITEITYESDAIYPLPGITICTNKKYLLKDEYLTKVLPNGFDKISMEDRYWIIEAYLNNLTISEQYKLLLTPDEFLKNKCRVDNTMAFNFSYEFVPCNNISSYNYSIGRVPYCFTLFSQLNGEPDERYLYNYDNNKNDKLSTISTITS